MDTETNSNAVSRREILKRGAFVGGAILWVTPVVQAVGMGRAYAKDVSPNCTRYCMKWDVDGNPQSGVNTCGDNGNHVSARRRNTWTGFGNASAISKVLACPDRSVDDDTLADNFANRGGREFVVYEAAASDKGYWIAFPPDVKLADLSDVLLTSVGAKCGEGGEDKATFTPTPEPDPCFADPNNVPFWRINVPGCDSTAISHIEVIVDWCPNG